MKKKMKKRKEPQRSLFKQDSPIRILAYIPQYMDATVTVQFADPSKTKLFKELGFGNEAALETFVTSYIIPGVETHIAQILGVAYASSTVPEDVKMVAHTVGSHVLLYLRTNQMGPVIANPQGFNLQVPLVEFFTPDLLAMLRRRDTRTEQLASSEYKTDKIKETWEEE